MNLKKARPAAMLKPKPERKESAKKKNRREAYDPALVLFTAIQRLLPKFGIPLDIPNVCSNGLVVRSEKSESHPYAFMMEAANGMLAYGIQFTKSYAPEPHHALENAVAFAVEENFCFSKMLDAGQCGTTDAEEVAGDIVQKFTACVMKRLCAPQFIMELREKITDWVNQTKLKNPLVL